MPFADGGNNWGKTTKISFNFSPFLLKKFLIFATQKNLLRSHYEALGSKDIGTSVSMFFILKIVLRFFDKLFFFTFFVVWNF